MDGFCLAWGEGRGLKGAVQGREQGTLDCWVTFFGCLAAFQCPAQGGSQACQLHAEGRAKVEEALVLYRAWLGS